FHRENGSSSFGGKKEKSKSKILWEEAEGDSLVSVCENKRGDAYCSNRLATYDYCVLDAMVTTCDCELYCKSPTYCQ
ncbi:hypothetical protein BaRGS_00012394, partial [Batillaria attramentaria]